MSNARITVKPRPRQRDVHSNPDKWVIEDSGETFDNRQSARQIAKERGQREETTVQVYDSAKKSSEVFDYRTDEERRRAASDNLNREIRNIRF